MQHVDQNELATANKILKYLPWIRQIWPLSDLSNEVSMELEVDKSVPVGWNTVYNGEMRTKRKKARLACLREQDIRMWMGTLVEAKFAPETFQLWEVCL